MSILKIENLTHIYNSNLPTQMVSINDVSLEVEKGDFVGVIGPTGCGKSTLISHFNGILKPTSGKIIIDGVDIWGNGVNIRNYRFMVGLVFQYPEYQLFEETVYKDIAYGPTNMNLSKEEIHSRVMHAAEMCGISNDLLERSPFELSGGQKRRVAIAGIIAMKPEILVLDEPAAGLDPEGRELILSQVKKYHEETGCTVILVSHSMEDIAEYAKKILVLQDGKVVMYDTTENVFANTDKLLEIGLSVPQVTQVFIKLKEMGIDINTNVYTLPYAIKKITEYLQKNKEVQDA